MPFDTTRVIHPDWSKHHAPVAAGGMNATVVIRNPAEATTGYDETTDQQTSIPGPAHYDGPARVQELNDSHDAAQADQQVTTRTYLLQLLFDAPQLEQGWHVEVTACANDTNLVARTADRPMVVTDVQSGSERFTRDLVATINLD